MIDEQCFSGCFILYIFKYMYNKNKGKYLQQGKRSLHLLPIFDSFQKEDLSNLWNSRIIFALLVCLIIHILKWILNSFMKTMLRCIKQSTVKMWGYDHWTTREFPVLNNQILLKMTVNGSYNSWPVFISLSQHLMGNELILRLLH